MRLAAVLTLRSPVTSLCGFSRETTNKRNSCRMMDFLLKRIFASLPVSSSGWAGKFPPPHAGPDKRRRAIVRLFSRQTKADESCFYKSCKDWL